jgi:hypothetical protein
LDPNGSEIRKSSSVETVGVRAAPQSVSGPESLLHFDPHIRCIYVVGLDGKAISSASREGLVSLEPEGEMSSILSRTAIGMGMGSTMDKYHGKFRAVVAVRERVSIILFPLFDRTVLISADPDFPLTRTWDLAKLLDTISFGVIQGRGTS